MSLHAAVGRDLEKMNEDVRDSALAHLALAMADSLDHKPSALMAHELRETLDRLRELSPPLPAEDDLDKLRQNRDHRRRSA